MGIGGHRGLDRMAPNGSSEKEQPRNRTLCWTGPMHCGVEIGKIRPECRDFIGRSASTFGISNEHRWPHTSFNSASHQTIMWIRKRQRDRNTGVDPPAVTGSSFLRSILPGLALMFPVSAGDWPQWLGPQRDAIWRDNGILESFPVDGPPLRWKTAIGSGYSGPAVADGRVFVMDRIKAGGDPAKAKLLNQADSPINANFERRRWRSIGRRVTNSGERSTPGNPAIVRRRS